METGGKLVIIKNLIQSKKTQSPVYLLNIKPKYSNKPLISKIYGWEKISR